MTRRAPAPARWRRIEVQTVPSQPEANSTDEGSARGPRFARPRARTPRVPSRVRLAPTDDSHLSLHYSPMTQYTQPMALRRRCISV